jgi:hypothetical protein
VELVSPLPALVTARFVTSGCPVISSLPAITDRRAMCQAGKGLRSDREAAWPLACRAV